MAWRGRGGRWLNTKSFFVPPRPQTSEAQINKVPAVVITNKAKAALTFTAAALICLQPALHACVANAQSGIQTQQRNDRWVMQCDDRAQTAAALFLDEDSVCHTPICTRQIHQSHYAKAGYLFSLVLVDI